MATSYLQTEITLDKLSICYSPKNEKQIETAVGLLSSGSCFPHGSGFEVQTTKLYKASAILQLPVFVHGSQQETVCIQAGPKFKSGPGIRAECNPAKLSPEGMVELRGILQMICGVPSSEFFSSGSVTRCDVAIDVPGVDIDSWLLWFKGYRKHRVSCDRYGNPQSMMIGSRRSKHLLFYDKMKEGAPFVRVEFRLKPNCPGSQIAGLPNPLDKVKSFPAKALDSLLDGVPGKMIADTIRTRGLTKALLLLPKTQRKIVEAALYEACPLIPEAEKLWEYWPDALSSVGLGDEFGVSTNQSTGE